MKPEPQQPSSPLKISTGSVFVYQFSFSQKDVNDFVALSGDTNNIHLDREAALKSPIGEMTVHGMLTATIFSRVLGTMFPGNGTVYRSQSLEFLHPVIVGKKYEARFEVLKIEVPSSDHTHSATVRPRDPRATIKTTVVDAETGAHCVEGKAVVLNKERLSTDQL
jgi:acyl dehydratase